MYECNSCYFSAVSSDQFVISAVGALLCRVLGNCFAYKLTDSAAQTLEIVICVCMSVWYLGEPNVAVIC